MQLALEPLWKLYEVCQQGADVKASMSKAVKSLGLTQASTTGKIQYTLDFKPQTLRFFLF